MISKGTVQLYPEQLTIIINSYWNIKKKNKKLVCFFI